MGKQRKMTKKGVRQLKGSRYWSPSGAAEAIVERRTVNGWGFWKYRDGWGGLRALADLRIRGKGQESQIPGGIVFTPDRWVGEVGISFFFLGRRMFLARRLRWFLSWD